MRLSNHLDRVKNIECLQVSRHSIATSPRIRAELIRAIVHYLHTPQLLESDGLPASRANQVAKLIIGLASTHPPHLSPRQWIAELLLWQIDHRDNAPMPLPWAKCSDASQDASEPDMHSLIEAIAWLTTSQIIKRMQYEDMMRSSYRNHFASPFSLDDPASSPN